MANTTETIRHNFDPYLQAFHTAFEPELSAAVSRYRWTGSERVLDVPCGNGFYTALFARYMRDGVLTAADQSDECLADVERRVSGLSQGPSIEFRRADVYAMPFAAATFDFVWCAQSMISLTDPVSALREMRRVLRPGGRVAVLETDEFHHVVLPWPVPLELSLQRGVREACKRDYGDEAKFAQARTLRSTFSAAGLTPGRKRTLVADRSAPFGVPESEFLREHFRYMRKRIVPELTASEQDEFDRFTDQSCPDSLLNRPDAEMTVLASIHHARA